MDELVKKSIRVSLIVVLTVFVILAALQKFSWAVGFLTSAIWSVLNFLLTVKLLKSAIADKSRRRLPLMLSVKFPLLYLVGYLILISRRFPLSSLLAGLLPLLAVMGVMKLCLKRI